jgi:hypothetical protein
MPERSLGSSPFSRRKLMRTTLDGCFLPSRTQIFDKFCILSLTYWNNGFTTALAPLRDHLSPKYPTASLLLCATKENHFVWMSVDIDPNRLTFGESQWITSEGVNVEYLIDTFTTIGGNSDGVWDACRHFTMHLIWHKKRLTILKLKVKRLPDDRRSKPECLFELSRLFNSAGNDVEHKDLLSYALTLRRERRSDHQVATILADSYLIQLMGLHDEGLQQAKEALEVYERLGETVQQADRSIRLAGLLSGDNQFDAAEEAAFRAIKSAGLFRDEGRLDDAQPHLEHARSHTVDSAYDLGYAVELQARVWHEQHRLDEAKSEALRAVDIYEKLGAAEEAEGCREPLRNTEEERNTPVASGQSNFTCELL